MKVESLFPVFVEEITSTPEPGINYVSEKYTVAVHLCACGCGEKVVLPFTVRHDDVEGKWNYWKSSDCKFVSFNPSVGNWQFKCKSHYLIAMNKIIWL